MWEIRHLQSEEVSQDLDGMVEVGQAIDDGDWGSLLQLLQCGVTVHSSEDNVTESRENTEVKVERGVRRGTQKYLKKFATKRRQANMNTQTHKNNLNRVFTFNRKHNFGGFNSKIPTWLYLWCSHSLPGGCPEMWGNKGVHPAERNLEIYVLIYVFFACRDMICLCILLPLIWSYPTQHKLHDRLCMYVWGGWGGRGGVLGQGEKFRCRLFLFHSCTESCLSANLLWAC